MAIASESHPAISDGYAQVGWTHQAGIPIDFRLRKHPTKRYVWQYPIPSTGPSVGMDGHSRESANHLEFAIPMQELHGGLQRTLDLARCEVRQMTDDSPWSE